MKLQYIMHKILNPSNTIADYKFGPSHMCDAKLDKTFCGKQTDDKWYIIQNNPTDIDALNVECQRCKQIFFDSTSIDPIEEMLKNQSAPFVLSCLKQLQERGQAYASTFDLSDAFTMLMKDIEDDIRAVKERINNVRTDETKDRIQD